MKIKGMQILENKSPAIAYFLKTTVAAWMLSDFKAETKGLLDLKKTMELNVHKSSSCIVCMTGRWVVNLKHSFATLLDG